MVREQRAAMRPAPCYFYRRLHHFQHLLAAGTIVLFCFDHLPHKLLRSLSICLSVYTVSSPSPSEMNYLNYPASGKGSKLLRYIEHRLRISLIDGRTIVGTFLAFDKHLNLVLVDSEEYRSVRSKSKNSTGSSSSSRAAIVEERVEKRTLGLIILRGENVVSVAVEGPPPPNMKSSAANKTSGGGSGENVPGVARGAGRGGIPPQQPPSFGVGVGAPMGLGAAPVHGVGMMGGMSMPPPPGPPPPMMMMGRGMPPGPPPGMGRGGGGGY